jgi:uncharacterized membrane protein
VHSVSSVLAATIGAGDRDGAWSVVLRAAHILSGITWIGLLCFFNFVQTPSFGEMSDGARGEALRKITYRALWWFRYAALATFLFGLALLSVQSSTDSDAYFGSATGVAIITGMIFGVTMFLNVWGIIWRHQKVIIASSESVAAGGEADPRAAALAKPAARASRCNTLMSIPMLFFMVFAPHGGILYHSGVTGGELGYWILVLVVWAVIEGSALGLLGGFDNPFNKAAFDKHQNTIWFGFGVLALIWLLGWMVLLKP